MDGRFDTRIVLTIKRDGADFATYTLDHSNMSYETMHTMQHVLTNALLSLGGPPRQDGGQKR